MERQQHKKDAEEMEKRFKRAAGKMANRVIGMAFSTWLEEHDKMAMLKRIMVWQHIHVTRCCCSD